MFGLDTRSVVIGLALGFFVAPVVLGKVRGAVASKKG